MNLPGFGVHTPPRQEIQAGSGGYAGAQVLHLDALWPCRFLRRPKLLDNLKNMRVPGAIDVRETIVEVTVSDLSKSREWYSRLFGKGPDLEPFPGNVEFRVGGAWVQIG